MKLPQWLNRFLTGVYLRHKRVEWEGEVPRLDMLRPPVFMVEGRLLLGSGVEFFTDTIRTRIQVDKGAELRIGNNTLLNNVFQIRASTDMTIGDGSGIGPYVRIRDANHHEIYPGYVDTPRPIRIGNNCYIGEFSTIMPGVSLGENCFVGSQSKVTKSFPRNVVLGGDPARIHRAFKTPDTSDYPQWFRKRKK